MIRGCGIRFIRRSSLKLGLCCRKIIQSLLIVHTHGLLLFLGLSCLDRGSHEEQALVLVLISRMIIGVLVVSLNILLLMLILLIITLLLGIFGMIGIGIYPCSVIIYLLRLWTRSLVFLYLILILQIRFYGEAPHLRISLSSLLINFFVMSVVPQLICGCITGPSLFL